MFLNTGTRGPNAPKNCWLILTPGLVTLTAKLEFPPRLLEYIVHSPVTPRQAVIVGSDCILLIRSIYTSITVCYQISITFGHNSHLSQVTLNSPYSDDASLQLPCNHCVVSAVWQ